MSGKTVSVIKATAPVVAPLAKDITTDFYPRLLGNNPSALAFFNATNQKKGMQQQALADAVIAFASNIDRLGVLGPAVAKISHRHCALGVVPELYQIVHDTLLESIGEVLGDAVTPEIGEAWSNAVMALAEICITEEEKLYTLAEGRRGGWRHYKEFELVKKQRVGEDTVAFTFKACDQPDTPIDFTSGQYLSIRVDEQQSGVKAPRHYTVTSRPGDAFLQCTTRHVRGGGGPDGLVSSYMHTKMSEGDRARLAAPFGVFTADQFAGEEVVFVTAGIGATLAHALAPAVTAVGALHVDRSPGHTGAMVLDTRNTVALYGEPREAVMAAIRELGEQLSCANFVLCGPIPFMKGARAELQAAGASKVHYELFGTGNMK